MKYYINDSIKKKILDSIVYVPPKDFIKRAYLEMVEAQHMDDGRCPNAARDYRNAARRFKDLEKHTTLEERSAWYKEHWQQLA